jgi:ribose transport system ATP-binding protein
VAFLEVHRIRKEYPGVVALVDVDFSVDLGRVHVLAGENGAGKSTLVKILTGVERPTRGEVRIAGRDALQHPALFDQVAYVPQELTLFPQMTVAENLFMPFRRSGVAGGLVRSGALHRAAAPYIERFRIAARPQQLVRDVSVSDQQLIQIARAATRKDFQALILDEPTSSLTDREIERLFQIVRELRDTRHAVIFISHKLEEMFAIGDEVTVLRNGEKVGQAPMAELTEAELVKRMSGKEIKLDVTFRPAGPPRRPVLEVRGLSGPGFEDVSFVLREGEILGFAGLVGAGRSELMQTVFGYLKARGGEVRMDGTPWRLGDTSWSVRHGMLYLSESRKQHGILPLLSVRENVAVSILRETLAGFLISDARERRAVEDVIRTYDIRTPSLERKIIYLSGGNQQKVIIGRAMASRPRVLVFDEPTKGIDVRTKADIYGIMKALAEGGMGIVLVSSELGELQRCASRILTMYRGRINGEFVTERTGQRELVGAIIGLRGAEAAAPAAQDARPPGVG